MAYPPDAPTGVVGSVSSNTLFIYWSPPATGLVSSYTVVALGFPTSISRTVGSSVFSATLTVTNGVTYLPVVIANRGPGLGSSDIPYGLTPSTIPLPPTGVRVVYNNTTGYATISWTAPASNGGAIITSYNVISSPPGINTSVSGLSADVNGFTYGTPYNFTVTATNVSGTSLPSTPSGSFTPIIYAAPPTNINGKLLSTGMNISWQPPSFTGGTPITGYTIFYYGSNSIITSTVTLNGNLSSFSVPLTTLTNGVSYNFGMSTRNIVVGNPPISAQTNSNELFYLKPVALSNIKTSTIGTTSGVLVSWDNPTVNFGISSFNIFSIPNTTVLSTTNSSIIFPGLTYGTSYRFGVSATNLMGTSPAISTTNGVILYTIPATPSTLTATAGRFNATVSWTAPLFTGGSPITGYNITPYNITTGSILRTISTSATVFSILISSLTATNLYNFGITAQNITGSSVLALTSTVSVYDLPMPPVNLTATPKNTVAVLNWIEGSTMGAPIISYSTIVRPSANVQTMYIDTSSCTAVFGFLDNGTTYNISLIANNAAGASLSTNVSVTPTNSVVTPAYIPNPGLVSGPRIYAQTGDFVSVFAQSSFQNFCYAIPFGTFSTITDISTMISLTPGAVNLPIDENVSIVLPQYTDAELTLNNGNNGLGPSTVVYRKTSEKALFSGADQFSSLTLGQWEQARYINNILQGQPVAPRNMSASPINMGAIIQWNMPSTIARQATKYNIRTVPAGGVSYDYNISKNIGVVTNIPNRIHHTIFITAENNYGLSPTVSTTVTAQSTNLFGYISSPTEGQYYLAKAGPYVSIFGKANFNEYRFAIPIGRWNNLSEIQSMSRPQLSQPTDPGTIYGNDGNNVSVVFPVTTDLMLVLNNGDNLSGPTTLIYTQTTPFSLSSGGGGQFIPPNLSSAIWNYANSIWCHPVYTLDELSGLVTTPLNNSALIKWITPPTSGGLSTITNYSFTTNPPGGVCLNFDVSSNAAIIGNLINQSTYTISMKAISPIGISPVASASVTPISTNLIGYIASPTEGQYYLAKAGPFVSIFGKANFNEYRFAIPIGKWNNLSEIQSMSRPQLGQPTDPGTIYGNDGNNVSVVFPMTTNLMLVLNNGNDFTGPTTLIYTRTTPFSLSSGGGGQFIPPNLNSAIWQFANSIWCHPVTTTEALTILVSTPVNRGAVIRWTTPSTLGGLSTITSYTFTTNPPGGTCLSYNVSTNTAVLGNLINNSTYTISITAISPVGISPAVFTSVTPISTNLFGYIASPTQGVNFFAKAGSYVSIFGKSNYNEYYFAIPIGKWNNLSEIHSMSKPQLSQQTDPGTIYGNDGDNVSVVFPMDYNLMLILNNGDNFSGPTTLIYTRTTPFSLSSGGGGQFVAPNMSSNIWTFAKSIWCRQLEIISSLSLSSLVTTAYNGTASIQWRAPVTGSGISSIMAYNFSTSPPGGVSLSYNMSTNRAVIGNLVNNINYSIFINSVSYSGVSPLASATVRPVVTNPFPLGYATSPVLNSNFLAKAGPYVSIFSRAGYIGYYFAIPQGIWSTLSQIQTMSLPQLIGGSSTDSGTIYGNNGNNISVAFPLDYDLMLILNNGENFTGSTTLVYTRTTPFSLSSGADGQFTPPNLISSIWTFAQSIWCRPVRTTDALSNLSTMSINSGAYLSWSTPTTLGGFSTITGYNFTTTPPGGVCLEYDILTNRALFSNLANNTPYTISMSAVSPVGISPVISTIVTPVATNIFGYVSSPTMYSNFFARSGKNVSYFTNNGYQRYGFAIPSGAYWSTISQIASNSGGLNTNAGDTIRGGNGSFVFPVMYDLMLALNNGPNFTGAVTNVFYKNTPSGISTGGAGQVPITVGMVSTQSLWCHPIFTTGALTNLSAVKVQGGAFLSWSNPNTLGGLSTITSYEINTIPSGGICANLNITTRTAYITSLSTATPYSILIRSISPVGISPFASTLVIPM